MSIFLEHSTDLETDNSSFLLEIQKWSTGLKSPNIFITRVMFEYGSIFFFFTLKCSFQGFGFIFVFSEYFLVASKGFRILL